MAFLSPIRMSQGILPIGVTTVYSPPVGKNGQVTMIKFYNAAAYDITLSRYDSVAASSIDIYSLNLAAGDSLTDSSIYLFAENDQLNVTTTVANTSYIVSLIENL
jgi:hypothetical protein